MNAVDAAHASVSIESEIPADHPEKAGTEKAVRAVLAGVRGPWTAKIICGRHGTWWMVVVDRPGFRWAGFFGDAQQTAAVVTQRVSQALQEGHILD